MRGIVYLLLGLLLVLGFVVLLFAPRAGASGEFPPECHLIHVINPDGHRLWLRACGTGSGGESWVQDGRWARTLIADGFTLRSDGTCGSYRNPCVILAPLSPQS